MVLMQVEGRNWINGIDQGFRNRFLFVYGNLVYGRSDMLYQL